MPSVTGFTAARMLEIENTTIVDGNVVGDDLVLLRRDGVPINAGSVRGPIGPQMPPGSLTAFASPIAPSGWLFCYGQAISRELYADLFAAIGSSFGPGDGTTTFNLPDMRGRVPVGLDNMGGSDAGRLMGANTLGGSGGADRHTLSVNEMPSHTHDQNPHSHVLHGRSADATSTGSWYNTAEQTTHQLITNVSNGVQPATAVNLNSGGGQAHNNMQPYMLINYIIKT